MIFSNNPKFIILLNRNSLEVYNPEGQKNTLELPQAAFDNLEIVNLDEFSKLFLNFITKAIPKKDHVILVLSNHVTFYQKIDNTDVQQAAGEVESFYSQVPISPERVVKLKINLENSQFALAANKYTIGVLKDLLARLGIELEAVLPLAVLNADETKVDLTPEDIKTIFEDNQLIKQNDLLKEPNKPMKEEAKKELPEISSKVQNDTDITMPIDEKRAFLSKSAVLMLLAGILLICGLAAAILYRQNYISEQALLSQATASPSTIIEATPAAEITPKEASAPAKPASEVDAKNFSVLILNGSGVSGQAAKARDQIKPLGFTNIEVDNADSIRPASLIQYSTVPEELISKLKATLATLFTSVTTEKADSLDADIVITTGKDLTK